METLDRITVAARLMDIQDDDARRIIRQTKRLNPGITDDELAEGVIATFRLVQKQRSLNAARGSIGLAD